MPLEESGAVHTWQGVPEGLGARASGSGMGGQAVSEGCPVSSGRACVGVASW